MKKRLLSMALTVCMVMTLLPAITMPASAADFGFETINGITFKVNTSDATQVNFAGKTWYVIGANSTGLVAKSGCITLLSPTNLSGTTFGLNCNYSTSNLKTAIDNSVTFSTKEAQLAPSIGLSGNASYDTAKSTGGMYGDSVNATLWPLSDSEACLLNNSLKNSNYDWWLRSPGSDINRAEYVLRSGGIFPDGADAYYGSAGVRPALRIDLSSTYPVLFASAAAGGSVAAADDSKFVKNNATPLNLRFKIDDLLPTSSASISASNTALTYSAPAGSVLAVEVTANGNTYVMKKAISTAVSGAALDAAALARSNGIAAGSYTGRAWVEKTENAADNSGLIAAIAPVPFSFNLSYTATITVNKNGEAWTSSAPTITLKNGTDSISGTVSGNTVTFDNVDSSKEWSVLANGVATGKTVSGSGLTATLDYYTLSVSGEHMTGAYVNASGTTSYVGLLDSTVAINGGTAETGYEWDKWTLESGVTPTWTATTQDQTVTIKGVASLTAMAKLAAPTITVTGKNGAGTTKTSTNYEDTITLTAAPSHALGDGVTYTYQWYKGETADGNLVSGATNPTLLLRNVSDSGDYYCKVTAANSESPALVSSVTSAKTTVTISQKPAAFTVSGTSQTYQPGAAKSITITDTGTKNLTASDFAVKYYKVDEDNNVLASQTPVANAISMGRYLYVIDFAAARPNYTITRQFAVNDTTLPTIANYDNVGYLDINAGTEQQQPISFASGSVSKYVADGAFTNVLTNPNGTTAAYASSNTSVATVATDGTVTIKAAGSSTITATSSKDGTSPVYASFTLTVTKEAVTVTVQDKTIQYSDVMPYTDGSALSFSKSIDKADYVATGLSFSGYTQGKGAGEYTVIAKGLSSDKYSFTYEAGTLTVNPKILTASDFTVTAQDKTYDVTKDAAVSASVSGLYGSDSLGVTISGSFQDENAGTGKTVNYTIIGLTGTKAGNYALQGGSIAGTATAAIGQATVTVSCQSQSVSYDGTAKTIPLTAYVDGKLFTGYTVTYQLSGETETAQAPSAVGVYTIGIALTDSANYTANPFNATLTIKTAGQDSFDVTGVPDTVTYGDPDFTLTAVGNMQGSTVTYAVTSGGESAAVNGNTVTLQKPGTVTITATSKLAGYGDKTKTVTFTVKKRAVNVTAQDQTMTYGDAFSNVVNGYAVTGAVADNAVTGTATYTTNYTQAKGAGSYLITPAGLTSDYYSFIYEPGTLTVDPKPLTASDFTVSVANKEYDGTTSANFTITVNVVTGDALAAVYTGAFSSANAADSVTAACNITGVTGSKADSYVVNSAITKTPAAKISPMPITFTFGTTTYLYDGQQKAVTVSGVDSKNRVFSDFTVKYDDSTTPPSAVGDYAVTTVLADEANYTTSANMATLTITEGNVVVWASAGTSQKYDGSEKNITAMSAPNVPTVVTYYAITDEGKVGDSVDAPTAVGKYLYVITQTDANYKIKNAVSFVTGAVASLSGSNFGIMEIAESVQPSLSFSDPLVNKTYGDTAFTETPAGGADGATITYQSSDTDIVTVNSSGEVTIVKPGLATITATAQKDGFGDVTATYAVQIGKKAVALSMDAETSVTYKGENWIIPYQLTGDLDGNKLSVSDITFTYTDQSDPNKHTPKNAGTYLAIAQVKADNEFYTSGQATGLLKITPAQLTVTADDKTITYGDIAPAYTVSYTPLGDDVLGCLDGTAAFDCAYQQFDDQGTCPIIPSGLGSANYVITFHAGTLTINPKTVALSWSANSLPYSGAAQSVTATVGGLVNGDAANVTAYTGNAQTDVSSAYSATASALNNANYTLTGSANVIHNWSITAVAPTLTLGSQTSSNTGSPIAIGAAKIIGVGNDGDMTVQYSTTYTYYTDAVCHIQTTTADGAAANGGAPSKNGTYYVKAEISAQGNYTGAMAIATLTINAPSSGDSGASGGGSTTVTVPVIGSGTTVKTDVTTSGSTVTVKEPTASNLEKVVDAAAADKQPVEIDLSALSGTLTNVVLPANTISAAGKSAQSEGVSGLIVIAPNGNQVTFDRTSTAAIADMANGGTLTLSINERALSQQTADETALLSGRSAANIFDLTLKDSSGSVVSAFDGGTATVILKNIKMVGDLSNFALFHKTGGKLIAQSFTRTATGTANVYDLTIPTTGWSSYILTYDEGSNPFTDVASDWYYYDAVLWALDKGITSGTTATTFVPDAICTRAQAATFLWRAMGSPEPTATSCPFTDVAKDAYYYKAVLWATEKGITIGTSNTTFSPDATVTRSQTVTFLWRTADKPTVTTANVFGDVNDDAYYANAVLWAVSEGITSGTGTATFSPADGCTRAQIVTFLYRYLSK